MQLQSVFEKLYTKYNKKEFVHPDPIEFLYSYQELVDREIVALLASTLAYGRVGQILKSVKIVLNELGMYPHQYLKRASSCELQRNFKDFKHRFTTSQDLCALFIGIQNVLKKYDSLGGCFDFFYHKSQFDILVALAEFQKELLDSYEVSGAQLLPLPFRGSACKRLHLFLRWMVRCDEVDPGGWNFVEPSKLIIPLDVHMHRIGRKLSFTKRKSADLKTAQEITEGFRKINTSDPVKYDFVLTRFGIRNDLDWKEWF